MAQMNVQVVLLRQMPFVQVNKNIHVAIINIHCLIIDTDKCLLPYYGNCSHNKECIELEGHGVRCGDCLPGFRRFNYNDNSCEGNI